VAHTHRWLALAVVISWLTCSAAGAEPIPAGAGKQQVVVNGEDLTVYTYRPSGCSEPVLLIVMHGLSRNADGYRDYARPLADRDCMLVVAPRFDKKRFPGWRYQHGGIVHKGAVQEANQWTGNFIVALVEQVRAMEGRRMPYSLIGHSAGGQFLSRLAAFVPTEAQRIVVANPGTHVMPSVKTEAPFGLGGVYPNTAAEAELRRYLAQPLTIFLGQDDTGEENLNESSEAMAQGKTRYARGLNAFKAGQSLAQSRSWPFNWRLVELPGTGHSASKMFASKEASQALKP
jgi:pimeloyl-ACP methyl ester carboxylesterase